MVSTVWLGFILFHYTHGEVVKYLLGGQCLVRCQKKIIPFSCYFLLKVGRAAFGSLPEIDNYTIPNKIYAILSEFDNV